MEINQNIVDGEYDKCYFALIQNIKTIEEQRQLKEFIEASRIHCCSSLLSKVSTIEKTLETQYNRLNSTSLSHSTYVQGEQIKQFFKTANTFNYELKKKLEAAVLFGSVIYSLGDFRLKQEKIKCIQLQGSIDKYKQKNDKLKKVVQCFKNMCKTKDELILQLKSKLFLKENESHNSNSHSPNSAANSTPRQQNFSIAVSDISSPESDMYTYSFGKLLSAEQQSEFLPETIIQEESNCIFPSISPPQESSKKAKPISSFYDNHSKQEEEPSSPIHNSFHSILASFKQPYPNETKSPLPKRLLSLSNGQISQQLDGNKSPSNSMKCFKQQMNNTFTTKSEETSLNTTSEFIEFSNSELKKEPSSSFDKSPLAFKISMISSQGSLNSSSSQGDTSSPKKFIIHKIGQKQVHSPSSFQN